MGMNRFCAPIFQECRWIFNTLFHQCIAVLTITTIWIPIEHYCGLFSWHVILCTLGILLFMTEALILFSNDNVWSQETLKRHKYQLHGILFLIGTLLVIMGIAFEITLKRQHAARPHFESEHAITGLICMISLVFALVSGPFAFTTISNRCRCPVLLKLGHNLLGQFSYILGIVCLCSGFYTSWFSLYTSSLSRVILTIATTILTIWSLLFSLKSLYRQIRAALGFLGSRSTDKLGQH